MKSYAIQSKIVYFILSIYLFGCGNDEIIIVDCIDFPIELSIESISEATCGNNDASFIIAATGGNGNYQYSLDGATPQSSGDYSNLGAGEYQVYVIDQGGCDATLFVTLQDNGNVAITEVTSTNADCGTTNGSITITANGGTGNLSYSIDGNTFKPTSTINNLSSGLYTVTAQDVAGCIATSTIEILENGGIIIDGIETTDAGCDSSNGSVTISASGGDSNFTYNVDGGAFQNSNTFSNLSNGIHSLTIKDTGGCQKSSEVLINSGVSYQQSIKTIIQNSCATSGCHVAAGGRVDFTMLANVQSYAEEIKTRTQSGNMPKRSKLSQEEIDLIACWVDDGGLDN